MRFSLRIVHLLDCRQTYVGCPTNNPKVKKYDPDKHWDQGTCKRPLDKRWISAASAKRRICYPRLRDDLHNCSGGGSRMETGGRTSGGTRTRPKTQLRDRWNNSASPLTGNRLIAALTEDERREFLRRCELVDLRQEHVFYAIDKPISHGYFLVSGMSSELIYLRDGRAMDSGPVGTDGFVGLPLLFGESIGTHDCVMQIPGRGWRVPAEIIQEIYRRQDPLGILLHRYVRARLLQSSQLATCNLLHTIKERLVRWLLTAHDHSASDKLPLTHEFLSEMLGANRSTVTLTARELDAAGLIEYRRGELRIRDREGLLNTACECYATINDSSRRITEIRE